MNHYSKILEEINFLRNNCHSERLFSECNILNHLIELIGEEKFNTKIENYFSGDYPDSFDESNCEKFNNDFYNFHKSMRQTDFYNIGEGHLDMIFWNFIQISNVTEKCFRLMFNKD